MAVQKQIIGSLVGKTIHICTSPEKWCVNKDVMVTDETKHMITFICDAIEKKAIKNTITFRIPQNETNT